MCWWRPGCRRNRIWTPAIATTPAPSRCSGFLPPDLGKSGMRAAGHRLARRWRGATGRCWYAPRCSATPPPASLRCGCWRRADAWPRIDGLVAAFTLPRGTGKSLLLSRVAVPADLDANSIEPPPTRRRRDPAASGRPGRTVRPPRRRLVTRRKRNGNGPTATADWIAAMRRNWRCTSPVAALLVQRRRRVSKRSAPLAV